mmetsp:Transcript_42139/g.119601  ORF Transcript_42139/g.119601 Transcript_42139/m.119601 type:complete len:289 (-) Transcript_42139:725-1591(-)
MPNQAAKPSPTRRRGLQSHASSALQVLVRKWPLPGWRCLLIYPREKELRHPDCTPRFRTDRIRRAQVVMELDEVLTPHGSIGRGPHDVTTTGRAESETAAAEYQQSSGETTIVSQQMSSYREVAPLDIRQRLPGRRGFSEYQDGRNIFVQYIPYEWKHNDLVKHFLPYGSIPSARVVYDEYTGLSRGFGFVSFDSPQAASTAIEKTNGTYVDGRRLLVELKRQGARRSSEPQQGANGVRGEANTPATTAAQDKTDHTVGLWPVLLLLLLVGVGVAGGAVGLHRRRCGR